MTKLDAQKTDWEYKTDQEFETSDNTQFNKKILKIVKKYIRGMRYIPGGTFTGGKSDRSALFTKADSGLLVNTLPKRVSLSSFYLCDHELTNAEYRRFVHWVRDSIARTLLADNGIEGYRNKQTGRLLWDKKIEWDSDNETCRESLRPLYYPENERFYRRKAINYRKLSYTYTKDSTQISIAVYPDTLVWMSGEMTYSYNRPISKRYFWHPDYDDHPVIGITWEQANAYCDRLTKLVRSEIMASGIKTHNYPVFSLPSEAMWEYAAVCKLDQNVGDKPYTQNLFPWDQNNVFDKKGNCLANFGPIIDRNGFTVKDYSEGIKTKSGYDGYLYTAPVKSFPPNAYQLYDLGGNVAEWVLDYACVERFSGIDPDADDLPFIQADDDFQTARKKLIQYYVSKKLYTPDTTADYFRNRLNYEAQMYLHDARVIARNPKGRIVKGGSWARGPKYLQCASREVLSQNKRNAFTGFRVAILIPEKEE